MAQRIEFMAGETVIWLKPMSLGTIVTLEMFITCLPQRDNRDLKDGNRKQCLSQKR